jgi:small conductance mechanosensitive channel
MPRRLPLSPLEQFTDQATRYAPKVALALALVLAGAAFARLLRSGAAVALRRTRLKPSAVHLGIRLAGLAGWLLVGTIVLSTLQLQAIVLGLSGVLALMGAAFVASASGICNDIIAGAFLASDPDIEVGYRVQAAGVQGVVYTIDFRKTRILDDQGHLHVIPNRLVEGAEWIVLSRGA